MEFDIHRYLLANTYNRLDGNEKYERHVNISIHLYEFLTCEKYNEIHDFPKMRNIHDYLAEILTIVKNLDEIENQLYNGEFSKNF